MDRWCHRCKNPLFTILFGYGAGLPGLSSPERRKRQGAKRQTIPVAGKALFAASLLRLFTGSSFFDAISFFLKVCRALLPLSKRRLLARRSSFELRTPYLFLLRPRKKRSSSGPREKGLTAASTTTTTGGYGFRRGVPIPVNKFKGPAKKTCHFRVV
ncbi:hypothetical protein HAX54_014956 [Datura stramonium]|uniref:Ribosomal protein L2 n=1 Tax=Datura stramonium TaxID=4076 RepID=A0ABS8TQW9_DATST|nr:hypothetical protein [Datura stramonium]